MMLTAKRMKQLFAALNDELAGKEVIGEIGLCGGAVMCLVYQAREATKDVDALFEPTKEMRAAARKVARRFHLDDHWLNDAAKAYFLSEPPREPVMKLSHLRIWAPSADYMLAMKCVAARFDTHDKGDVLFLIDYLDLKTADQVFAIISRYYPRQKVPAKTQFLVEEVMGKSCRHLSPRESWGWKIPRGGRRGRGSDRR